jgi:hypothetical protein
LSYTFCLSWDFSFRVPTISSFFSFWSGIK